LNSSVGGSLVAVAPPLAPCFGTFPGVPLDQSLCDASVSNFSDSFWRASQPGASQEPNWEQGADGADCYDAAKPCSLGNIPPFAVRARGAADVSAALRFAVAHSLRVVVKSSGHEYQGRSAGADALLVWLHALDAVTTLASFAPCAGDAPVPALAAGPGAPWGKVYDAADAARVNVVGGSEISVSACGGYTLGGGHSWMGPAHGMAVDNLLSVESVLANGSVVTASACENADLFWALRGGGGSSFAVTTKCTYRAHPFPAAGAAGAFITVELLQGNASFAVLMDGWLAYAPALSYAAANEGGVVAGGYFIPDLSAPEGTHEHMSFLLGFNGTTDQANAALAPLAAWVATQPQHLSLIGSVVRPFASLMQFHQYWDDSSEPTGMSQTLASRLVPLDVMRNDSARAELALALTEIVYTVGSMTGMFVTGGAVATADAAATSIHPGWRSAGFHVAFGAAWALNTSTAEQQAIFDGVSELNGLLRAVCDAPPRGPAAYWSEADFLEPNWQAAFWGDNYPRLQAVKAAVDPQALFSCHHCVELPA
jgi:FAD/FMN-containing dehydrogenase